MIRIIFLTLAVVVIVVEREVGVIALDQASAGRVVLGCRQRQASVFGQRIDGLHQAFSDQAAIVVLNGSGYDFGGRCRAAIYQDHQRIILASVASRCYVSLFWRRASVVRDDQLSLLQEFVGDAYAFA